MIRKIIQIDEEKCNGCGACASACQEGAIGMVDGKAKLLRDDYCDGLGNCLPVCPTDAIKFIEREAAAYDEEAVKANMAKRGQTPMGGCPGMRARMLRKVEQNMTGDAGANKVGEVTAISSEELTSQLMQWPVQMKLVPTKAPYFDGANLLIAADCTA